MFTRLRRLRSKLRRRNEENTFIFSVENSGLNPAQIDTARKGLKILALESKVEELSKQDILVFLYAMGLNPTEDILESKLHAFKIHEAETFTFGQLAHIWHSMLQDISDEEDILRRAFQFFDKDGNGEISVQELRTTMHELGDLLTEEELVSFVQIMDVNNDGVIGYQEFLSTLKTQAPDFGGEEYEQSPQDLDAPVGSPPSFDADAPFRPTPLGAINPPRASNDQEQDWQGQSSGTPRAAVALESPEAKPAGHQQQELQLASSPAPPTPNTGS